MLLRETLTKEEMESLILDIFEDDDTIYTGNGDTLYNILSSLGCRKDSIGGPSDLIRFYRPQGA